MYCPNCSCYTCRYPIYRRNTDDIDVGVRELERQWHATGDRYNPGRRYTSEEKDQVIAICRDTALAYRDIGRLTGISHDTVRRWCQDAGHPRKIGRTRVVPKGIRQQILSLYQNTDASISQIASALELPRTTVRDIIKHQKPESKYRRNVDPL